MKLNELIKPAAPEKIYGWRETQLSIARHYRGMKFRGASYVIDFADPDQPLVRQDIFQAEKKAAKAAKKAKAGKPKNLGDLFGATAP
jgi:hypothetical protein